jgi:hypothetical protein
MFLFFKRVDILQVDDEIDEDVMIVLLEPQLPPGFNFCNTEVLCCKFATNLFKDVAGKRTTAS